MKTRFGRSMVMVVACALAAAAIGAPGEPAGSPRGDAACSVPAADAGAHPLGSRAETLARFQQLPNRCLKDFFLACNGAAGHSLLDLGSAAACSIGYEALLSSGFQGDFHALLAWWRGARNIPSRHP